MDVALTLGGRRFMIRHNNQPDSWLSARGGARVDVRGGGGAHGGMTYQHLDRQIDQQKNTPKNICWP